MDPRLEQLADVIVELVARELQNEKSRRCPEKQNGGCGDFEHGKFTPPGATAPTQEDA